MKPLRQRGDLGKHRLHDRNDQTASDSPDGIYKKAPASRFAVVASGAIIGSFRPRACDFRISVIVPAACASCFGKSLSRCGSGCLREHVVAKLRVRSLRKPQNSRAGLSWRCAPGLSQAINAKGKQ
ncbi:hypothetical protein [Embleya sp. NPDC050493]|uniref:hypothetical protein n=1 Tax=Embleya sp. NPDC050493 TaxID=3363989 RepID=UPI0037B7CE61